MTWSYDTSLSTDKDKVRLLIGDTDTDNQIVTDEEISGMLSFNSDDVYESAAQLADSLAGQYARRQSIKIDGFSVDYSDRARHFHDLARRIRVAAKKAAGTLGSPFLGGISISEMDSVRDDSDRVSSRFEMDMHNHPGTDVLEQGEETEQS